MKFLYTLVLAAIMALSLPAAADELDLCVPDSTTATCLDARTTNNRASIRDLRGRADVAESAAAIGVASSSHHFRVDEHAPAQASIAVGGYKDEAAMSFAAGVPLGKDSFGAIHLGTSGDVHSFAGSITLGF